MGKSISINGSTQRDAGIDAFVYRLFDAPHTQVTIYQVIDDGCILRRTQW